MAAVPNYEPPGDRDQYGYAQGYPLRDVLYDVLRGLAAGVVLLVGSIALVVALPAIWHALVAIGGVMW